MVAPVTGCGQAAPYQGFCVAWDGDRRILWHSDWYPLPNAYQIDSHNCGALIKHTVPDRRWWVVCEDCAHKEGLLW